MRIEAITTCVHYSDFLEQSLPENLQHVDSMVVVTSHDDPRTRGVCQKYGVACVVTDVFTEWGDKFNKGRGIELGKAHCRGEGFFLHIDADTVLPHKFRWMLSMHPLDKSCIYGADRLAIRGYDAWVKHKAGAPPQHIDGFHVNANGLTTGSRLIHGQYGYCPIGYFQLWHSSAQRSYPLAQGSAEHTDVLFALQWPKEKRKLLPEVYVYHLESEDARFGANWDGRATKFFGPSNKLEEWHKQHPYRPHHHHHHHHHKPHHHK